VIAAKATPGKWADCCVTVPRATAAKLVAMGYVGIVRTLAYKPGAAEGGDITAPELAMLTETGLQVGLYQRVRDPGWLPGQCDGYADAVAARTEAQRALYPAEAHVDQDLEGPGPSTTAAQASLYSTDWSHGIAPYEPALYVGYGLPLDAQQLYELPHTSYGSDAAHRKVATRGVAWQQGAPFVLDGITFDSGTMQPDELGDLPIVATADALPDAA
jgi:hypothetical protein